MKKLCFTISLLLGLNIAVWSQTSTVVIAEVMYDHPLYDNEATKTGYQGEFMSLYNYEEEDVDISGWRIEITDMTASPQKQYSYTLPANIILPESGIAVIASRATNSNFNVLQFYGAEMPEESEGYFLLYTSTLAFPDTRSRIRLYNAQNKLQDELVYDGKSNALPDEPLLRAGNTVNSNRPLTETVSIQREKIIIEEEERIISRADYFAPDHERTVKLFDYVLEDYSYTAPELLFSSGVPDNLILTGTATGTNDHRTKTIESNQVIGSGTTQYWAEEEIILGPGFEVKAGAEFVAGVERDSVHLIKMMTYNLKGNNTAYTKHTQVVKNANPDVVAVQEVRGLVNFRTLKKKSGYAGKRFCTIADYGIGLLYKPSVVGEPIKVNKLLVATNDAWYEIHRGFIVAEFQDFCFVATHYSLNKPTGPAKMTKKLLANDCIKDCIKKGKPIYLAGDMNQEPDGPEIKKLEENDFVLLNNTEKTYTGSYIDSTGQDGHMIDFVLEHNQKPYHKLISRGVPFSKEQRDQYFNDKISDHLPYRVKVKIK